MAAVPAAQDNRLSVFIVAKASPFDAKGYAEATARRNAALREWLGLHKELTTRHGNPENWPVEGRARLDQLSADLSRLRFDAAFLFGAGLEAPQVEALIAPMSEKVGKAIALRIVADPAQADVVVETLDCVVEQGNAGLGVRVRPGGRVDEAAIVSAAPAWQSRIALVRPGVVGEETLLPISKTAPFWGVAAYNPATSKNLPGLCRHLGALIAGSLNAFALEHRETFVRARKR